MSMITEGKTLIEAVENAKNELQTESIFYKKEEIKKGGLFKSTVYQVTAISHQELLKEIKDYLKELTSALGLEVQFETSIREDTFTITMFSDNNAILIGKNGQTLKALETLCRAKINMEWNVYVKIVLDVENYKEKRVQALERLAIRTAKEVRDTKIPVALENMNSYERRIIHNKLANFKGISSASEGEEPNRHIVIKAE